MPYFAFASNIVAVDGDSAWNRRHKQGNFVGPMIPFGCRVYFRPTPVVKADEQHKFEANAIPGIFLGYRTLNGGRWKLQGGYYVADMNDFRDIDHKSPRQVSVQTVSEIIFNDNPPYDPLKERFENLSSRIYDVPQVDDDAHDAPSISDSPGSHRPPVAEGGDRAAQGGLLSGRKLCSRFY